jgi:broad specificity phosphatase PhoE
MLTFLRHGETAWNREGRIQGMLDVPLSAHGRRCVEQFVVQHPDFSPTLIWTSPLARARETAVILAKGWARGLGQLSIRELDLLAERNYGIYQGQRLADLPPTVLVKKEELLEGNGVESWHHVRRRVVEALRIIAAGPDEAMIVVHGGWLKVMHSVLQTGLAKENANNLSCYSMERATLISALDNISSREVRHEQ